MRALTERLGRGRARDERGANLVEFVIILPLLLLLVFGIIEFGINFDRKIGVTNAAREGARAAIVGVVPASCADGNNAVLSPAEVVCLTKDRLGLDDTKTQVEVIAPVPPALGAPVVVCVEYPVESITGIFQPLFSSSELKGKAKMRIEQNKGLVSGGDSLGWCSA